MTPLVYALLGAASLLATWLNLVLARGPLSLPMFAIAAGLALAGIAGLDQFTFTHADYVHQIVTFVLIVAVMGAGLAIDEPFRLGGWRSTWRLLGIVMPLCVAGIAAAAHWLLGYPWAMAILLGALIAPTDPVLASQVRVGPPGTGEEGELRFALTSEAGLNDGLAFPFVLLALGLHRLEPGQSLAGLAGRWLLLDLSLRTLVSLAVGVAVAWLLIRANRAMPERLRLPATRNGFVAVGLGLLVYGLSDMIHAYGLVAVFASAVALRNLGGVLEYEQVLHSTVERAERQAMVLVLFAFGAAIGSGLLSMVTWRDGVVVLLVLFVIRPAACLLAFAGAALPGRERLGLGLLGIRGLGSFFYAGYIVLHGLPGEWGARLWAVVGLTVLVSALFHGAGTEALLRWIERGDRAR